MLNAAVLRPQSLFSVILSIAIAMGMGLFIAESDYEWQGLLLVVISITIISILLVPYLARVEVGVFLFRFLIWGLVLRIFFAVGRIWTDFTLYQGVADPNRYHNTGIVIAQNIWRLEFDQVVPFLKWGTNFVELFTGFIYSIVGPTLYGGYLIYALFAFLGSYYFYRAFRVAFPQGNRLLYATLVFFFPSILFWSNSIGKDALISLCIGLFSYGGAQLTRDRLQGFMPLALGFIGAIYIRPHIAAILALAFVLAFLVRGVGKGHTRPVVFVTGLMAVGGLAWFLLPSVMAYVGLQELSAEGVVRLLQSQGGVTFEGGSAFTALDISSPLAFPMAIITVFFRPFPWEVHNLQALLQSLEGVILMCIILWRIKSLGRAIVSSISNAYIRFILFYIIAFVVAFISVQNFGILARERIMMLPLFFMLMAYLPFHSRNNGKAQEVVV